MGVCPNRAMCNSHANECARSLRVRHNAATRDPSGGRQCLRQASVDVVDGLQRTRVAPSAWSWGYSFLGHIACTPRVVKEPPTRGQSASTKRARPGLGSRRGKCARTMVELVEDAVHESGAVAGSDEEPFSTRGRRNPPLYLQVGPAAIPFGVDHVDPGGRDGEVVDVGSGATDSPVVEHFDGVGRELVETSSEPLFAYGANVPSLGRLRVVGEGMDESPELRMCGPDRSSRRSLRRSNSRRADAPAVPRRQPQCAGPGGGSVLLVTVVDKAKSACVRHRTVLVSRS